MNLKTKTNILISAFLLMNTFGFSQFNEYLYKKEVLGVQNEWHKIILPRDVFGKTSSSFHDLRIYGFTDKSDTIEAPYLLQFKKDESNQQVVGFNQINFSHNKQGYFYTFELENSATINEINLNFEEDNFDWKIKLEGSQNQTEWFTLLEDYRILSIKNDVSKFSFTKLKFNSAQYHFFRILIPCDTDPGLLSANVTFITKDAGDYVEYIPEVIEMESEKQKRETKIILTYSSPVSLSRLELSVQDEFDYYRPVTIRYLKDSVKTPKGWKYNYQNLQHGWVNSFELNLFEFRGTVLQQLEITIQNQDNPPLNFENPKTWGYVHELHVRFTVPATYFLVYGNDKAQAPQYDLHFFENKIPDTLVGLNLGLEQKISRVEKVESGPIFENELWLWAVMLIIIGLLGWFSIKMIKKA